MFIPPRCPHRHCGAHQHPRGVWFLRRGYYKPKCRRTPVPCFRCRVCGRGFSRQTFRHDYRDHRPFSNAPLLRLLVSGISLRQAARLVALDIHAVQRKLRKFAHSCAALHDNLSPRLPSGLTFLLDEEETFETETIRPLTMPVLIEKETWFVVATDAAPIRRLAQAGSQRRLRQQAMEARDGPRPDHSRRSVLGVLRALARRLDGGTLTLLSDEKSSYATLVHEVFGDKARHETTPGTAARTKRNPLFPINTTMAMTRDNNGRLRRRSWLVTKRCQCLGQQLVLFQVYRNYVRFRFNRDAPEQTPAWFLKLLPRALRVAEVLAWRQDWGDRSIHPMSRAARHTVAESMAEAA